MENNTSPFNAIKVDVSSISKKHVSKVAVVTSVTTVASIVADLLKKLKMKESSPGDFLFEAEAHHQLVPGQVEMLRFDDNDCPLDTYMSYPRGAVKFILRNKNGTNLKPRQENRRDELVITNIKDEYVEGAASPPQPPVHHDDLIRFDSPDVKPKPTSAGSSVTGSLSHTGRKGTSPHSGHTTPGSSAGSRARVTPGGGDSRGPTTTPGHTPVGDYPSAPNSTRSTPKFNSSRHQHTIERMRKGLEKLRRKPSDNKGSSTSGVKVKSPGSSSSSINQGADSSNSSKTQQTETSSRNLAAAADNNKSHSEQTDGKLDKPVHFVDRASLEYIHQQQQQQQQQQHKHSAEVPLAPKPVGGAARGWRMSPARSLQQDLVKQGVLLPEASRGVPPPAFRSLEDSGIEMRTPQSAHKVYHPQAVHLPLSLPPEGDVPGGGGDQPLRTSTQASSPLSPISSSAHSDGYLRDHHQGGSSLGRASDGGGGGGSGFYSLRRTTSMSLPQMKDAYTPPFMSESFELPKSRSLQSLNGRGGGGVSRRRSLPPLNVSKEHLEEKKSSMSHRLAKKINKYRKEGNKAILPNTFSSQTLQFLKDFNQFNRSLGRSDPEPEEAMSLTSLEVAKILEGKPAQPTNEDVEEYLQCVESDPNEKPKPKPKFVKKSSSFSGQTANSSHHHSNVQKPVFNGHHKQENMYNGEVEIVYDDEPVTGYTKDKHVEGKSHSQRHMEKVKLSTYVNQSMKSFLKEPNDHDKEVVSHSNGYGKAGHLQLSAVDIPLDGQGGEVKPSGYQLNAVRDSAGYNGASNSKNGPVLPIRPEPTYPTGSQQNLADAKNNNNSLQPNANGYVNRRHSTGSYDRLKNSSKPPKAPPAQNAENSTNHRSPRQAQSPNSQSEALFLKPLSLFQILRSHNTIVVYLEKGKYFKSFGILMTRTGLEVEEGRGEKGVVVVSNIIDGGPAANDGSLLPGDLIIEVNGHSVLQSSDKAVRSLLDSRSSLELVVARPKQRFIVPPSEQHHETY